MCESPAGMQESVVIDIRDVVRVRVQRRRVNSADHHLRQKALRTCMGRSIHRLELHFSALLCVARCRVLDTGVRVLLLVYTRSQSISRISTTHL